jgi:hypothetical protein
MVDLCENILEENYCHQSEVNKDLEGMFATSKKAASKQ